jgi:hypothetical protein
MARPRSLALTLFGVVAAVGFAFTAVCRLESTAPRANGAAPGLAAPVVTHEAHPAEASGADEVAIPNTDVAIDGSTLTDEAAWQGGAELRAGFEGEGEERLRASVSLLWGRGRLSAWFTSPNAPHAVSSDVVELGIAPAAGDEETVLAVTSTGEPRLRREKGAVSRELPLDAARFGVEKNEVDWAAETSVPLAALGLRGDAGERARVTLRRCVRGPEGAASARSCVQETAEAVLSADEPKVP